MGFMPDVSAHHSSHHLVEASRLLTCALKELSFAEPVSHVYLPTEYARRSHEMYLERYGSGQKKVLMLGMKFALSCV